MPRRVLIMGAAGRDFHNFNVVYRDEPDTDVVAFTATQIPFIDDRRYPPSLAGERYPDGIQIHDESELVPLIRDLQVDDVVFSYSDVSHDAVMHKASTALAAGANFVLLGPNATMLQPTVPTVAVTAVRTGVGKSQTTRAIAGPSKRPASVWSPSATRCRTGTSRRSACSGTRSSRTSTVTTARSRNARSTSPTSCRGPSSKRASTTERSWSKRRPNATCCCGTAATTISRSTARPCGSPSWILSARDTSSATTPGRPTCGRPG